MPLDNAVIQTFPHGCRPVDIVAQLDGCSTDTTDSGTSHLITTDMIKIKFSVGINLVQPEWLRRVKCNIDLITM